MHSRPSTEFQGQRGVNMQALSLQKAHSQNLLLPSIKHMEMSCAFCCGLSCWSKTMPSFAHFQRNQNVNIQIWGHRCWQLFLSQTHSLDDALVDTGWYLCCTADPSSGKLEKEAAHGALALSIRESVKSEHKCEQTWRKQVCAWSDQTLKATVLL